MSETKETKDTSKDIKLKVQEALQEEAYKGIVRIDSQTMRALSIKPGDVIEIDGGRKTVGIADRAYPADIGQAVIRMDGITRRNAKTGIGEMVAVRRVDVKEAKTITIAPVQQGVVIQADPYVFKRSLIGRAVVKGDIIAPGGAQRRRKTMTGSPFEDIFNVFEEGFMGNFGFSSLKFIVADCGPKQAVVITDNTEVKLSPKAVEVSDEKIPEVTYEDIGGLEEELKQIREMVELPLKHPEVFEALGIEPPKGVLLHGPPGTGKTMIAKAVANEAEANFILVNSPELTSKFYGETEKRIREVFEEAEKNAPSIIFFDEIDAIAPKREETYGEVERRMVAQLLAVMDGLKSRGRVVVIGATNRPNSLDPALRRPGRFDREMTIGVPNKVGRLKILQIHTRNMPLTKDVDLEQLAAVTHGFVGADLNALCKEAAMGVLRKVLPDLKLKEGDHLSDKDLAKLKVTMDDFLGALKYVRPSALREVMIESPNVKWVDVGGLEEVKQSLKEAVELPLKNPKAFQRLGIRPPRGILLYGPPGTGKTLLAKAVATESEANFISIKGPELISMWVGESEKGIKKVFEKARQAAPTVIFFDEIDAIAARRGHGADSGNKVTERMVNQLLTEMDGLEELNQVVVIGATNRPDLLDPALLRPGRFDRIVFAGVPDAAARRKIIEIHTKKMPLAKDVDIDQLTEISEGFVGADVESLCREAAMSAMRHDIDAKEVTFADFMDAARKVKPSLRQQDVEKYQEIEENYLRTARGAQISETNYMG
ncbi:MAG TPA: CDC48 family AAA ATPase [Candidatus Nanoarchaeia archaeon]|nr:CDC48 family AAA ATPase [Candidatus Nanoarchaeia archaeon]